MTPVRTETNSFYVVSTKGNNEDKSKVEILKILLVKTEKKITYRNDIWT